MAKSTITVRISDEKRAAIEAIESSVDRDRSYVVNEALDAFISTHQWQVDHIQQGLREAGRGEFVSGAEARKVIERLRQR